MSTPVLKTTMRPLGDAVAELHIEGHTGPDNRPIAVIGTEKIRQGFDEKCITQAVNSRTAPGVSDLVLNPDAHGGYGAPVGCVLVSPSHVYPGPVGVDIKCSMSLLQLDLPSAEIVGRPVRRALIEAIGRRIPTGAGNGRRSVRNGRAIDRELGKDLATAGATEQVCTALGIPPAWATRCEDAAHFAHDGTVEGLKERLEKLLSDKILPTFDDKMKQLGSYGGGNHFGEANLVRVGTGAEEGEVARQFGLLDNCISFLSHCGSRGFGFTLAQNQFKTMQAKFEAEGTPLPGGDRELVYAELGTEEADNYLDDMALGANFATLNHLLINSLVLEAFQEVIPGVHGELVYFISHNIARQEVVRGKQAWVHRKGATRAFPAGHEALRGTRYEKIGHPILLPGNPQAGSAIMVATPGAQKSCYSVNHGAGRALGRKAAIRALNQNEINESFERLDILTNCRNYPVDEAPAAYKDFNEVLRSVEQADLARTVARLEAKFVIKDGDGSLGGLA